MVTCDHEPYRLTRASARAADACYSWCPKHLVSGVAVAATQPIPTQYICKALASPRAGSSGP